MYTQRIKLKFKYKNSLFMLGSMLLHLLLFFLLNISDLGPKKEKEDEFKLNSIKVANMTSASKPKSAAKKAGKKPSRKNKKASKKNKKSSKTKTLKKTNMAKASPRKSQNIPKQIKYKTTKQVAMLKKTVRRQEYKVERNPVRRKQLMKKLNVPQVKTFKSTTSTLERVTRTKTAPKLKTPQIQRKTWRQNITKQVNKQSKPVRPTIQRKVVTTKQLEYKPRQEKTTPKIEEKRVVYKKTQKLIRQQIKPPTLLEVAEQPKQVTRQITQVRQVTKKTTLVNQKTQHKIKKLAVVRKEVEKQSAPVQPTVQRKVVTTKQLEYKPRREKPTPKIEENRVVYEKQTQSLNRKQLDTPQQLEVAELPEQVRTTEQITHFRQVTKQTTVVTRVISVPVIKDTITFDQVPINTDFVKENQQIMPTTQREVTLKQLEYEERVVSVETFEELPQKVTYQRTVTEQNVKAITDAPDIPFEEVPTQPAAVQVAMTSVARQATAAYDMAPTTMTQLPTAVSVEHHEGVEKTVTQSSEMSTKTMAQPKVNIETSESSLKQLAAYKESQSGVTKRIRSDSLSSIQMLPSGSGSDASEVKIEANLPSGNITNRQLYRLIGTVDSDVRTAFITTNDITQLVAVVDSTFVAEVALSKGVNNLKVMAFNGKGRVGTKAFKLIFNPPRGGIPTIHLKSPENGRQGVTSGEPILVEGTIDDPKIIKATLLLNRTPIPLKVKNGRFSKKVRLPEGKIFSFRVMAKNQNGTNGFSPVHTVLSTNNIDILNPRPY